MKKSKIILLILFLWYNAALGLEKTNAETVEKTTKNLVYIDYGAGFFGAQTALNYERTLFFKNGNNISLSGSYGLYTYFFPIDDYYNAAAHYSYGKRNLSIETALGISIQDHVGHMNPFKINDAELFPLFYVGCKIKKPNGSTVIKFGVGYPQLLSFGIGLAF